MSRARRIRLTLIAVCISGALAAGIAEAHHGGDPAIKGAPAGKLGLVQIYDGHFVVRRIKLECPPPEGGAGCPVTITVKTNDRFRLTETDTPKARITIARTSYVLAANRDHAVPPALVMGPEGVPLFNRYGPYIKATVRVKIAHEELVVRRFKLTLKY
jgi:hypothetical protein